MNMTMNNALNQYKNVGIHSALEDASPHRLIQMLIDGALARIAAAIGDLKRNAPGPKGKNIGVAISIIGGLQNSLDLKNGGEIAANLNRLYDYMNCALLYANLNNDMGKLKEVHGLLTQIKDGWDNIL